MNTQQIYILAKRVIIYYDDLNPYFTKYIFYPVLNASDLWDIVRVQIPNYIYVSGISSLSNMRKVALVHDANPYIICQIDCVDFRYFIYHCLKIKEKSNWIQEGF